jgi:CHAD domain-containing protein
MQPSAAVRGSELEWQFDAQDLRPVRRWVDAAAAAGDRGVTIAPGKTINQVDTYLDTPDRRLERAGYSVRIRKSRQSPVEATMKSLASNGARSDGLLVRLELAEPLDGEEPAAVARAPGPVGQRVRALGASLDVVPLFDVQTRRRAFELAADGVRRGELVLDDTAIREPGGRILGRLRRVEVEAPEEALDVLAPFVESLRADCGLQPATLSKYEAGLAASGMHRSPPEDFGRTTISPTDTVGEVGLAVLRQHFSAMLRKEPGTRLGEDIEELHDMRVASRRLRAALALFADSLPVASGELRDELGWIGRTIGAVRDLDVQLAQLDSWIEVLPEADREPLARLRALLVDERVEARREMLQALDSARYARFVRRFGTMLRSRTGTRTPAARASIPELVGRRYYGLRKAARRLGDGAEPTDYHRTRIAGKRFRYALEFVADVYPGATARVVRRTVALQDLLGAYQDGQVATERLRRLAAERGTELGPTTVFAMGEIAERYRREMQQARRRVPPTLSRLGGKAWKRLRNRMEAEHPATPAPPAVKNR